MATGANQKQPNRQGFGNARSSAADAMGMGGSRDAVLATEDANRFLVGLIIMLVVFAMLLPLTVFVYIDVLAVQASVKNEIKQLKKLKKELETIKEK